MDTWTVVVALVAIMALSYLGRVKGTIEGNYPLPATGQQLPDNNCRPGSGAGCDGTRVRAFGLAAKNTGVFGVCNNSTGQFCVPQNNFKKWSCGTAPAGKVYRLTGINVKTGSAIDSLQFECTLFDTK
jgi:hypothetical protein